MEAPTYLVEVRDAALKRVGQIDYKYLDLKYTEVHRGVGSWELKLPGEHPLLPTLKSEGSGIIVTKRWLDQAGQVQTRVYSGRMRTATLSQNAADPRGTWVVTGHDDGVVAAATVVLPDPASAPSAQTTDYWRLSAPAETVMKQAVRLNAGDLATNARKYPWLATAPDLARGAAVSVSARFDKLGDVLDQLGTAGGLGWRFYQSGQQVVFDVYPVRDLRKKVRLDIRNGGIESTELSVSWPTATKVYVMGQGEGASRKVRTVTSAAGDTAATAWGLRWEVAKDQRNTNDDAELDQAGQVILAESGSTIKNLKVSPSDAPGQALGVDWDLGDTVTVSIDGQPAEALVTQVATSVSAAGVIQQATVGDPVGYDWEARVTAKVVDHEERLSNVERYVGGGWDTGDLKPTARSTAPDGWLLCRGQAVSRTTYKALFDAIGVTYGAGNGTTTFNVPDFRERQPVGASPTNADLALGKSGGSKTKAAAIGTVANNIGTIGYVAQGAMAKYPSTNAYSMNIGNNLGGSQNFNHSTPVDAGPGEGNPPLGSMDPFLAVNFLIKT